MLKVEVENLYKKLTLPICLSVHPYVCLSVTAEYKDEHGFHKNIKKKYKMAYLKLLQSFFLQTIQLWCHCKNLDERIPKMSLLLIFLIYN